MSSFRIKCFATIFAMGALATASHALLVDPSGGTFIIAGDDATGSYALGGSFSVYGTGYSSVGACTNGYLVVQGTQSYSSYSNVAFPTTAGASGTANIAPMWDDLWSDSTQSVFGVSGKSGTGYDAITWDEQTFSSTSAHLKMQALLIRANVILAGFNFQTGDIAFSYDALNPGAGTITGTSGLNAGDGANFILSPGTVNGTESGANLPIFTAAGQFVLFRSNGNNGYNASIQAVPEPASMAILGAGALALIRRRRKA